MTECNWVGDPDARTIAHILQCEPCTNRWPHLADAARIGINAIHIGPRMADGTFVWSREHDKENCLECSAMGAWLGYS